MDKNKFEKDDYIIDFKTNNCIKLGHTGSGWVYYGSCYYGDGTHGSVVYFKDFDKTWRYANDLEKSEYDRLGKYYNINNIKKEESLVGHIDKIVKSNTLQLFIETLLKKAKEDYPKGTKYIPTLRMATTDTEISSGIFKYNSDRIEDSMSGYGIYQPSTNKWATIVKENESKIEDFSMRVWINKEEPIIIKSNKKQPRIFTINN